VWGTRETNAIAAHQAVAKQAPDSHITKARFNFLEAIAVKTPASVLAKRDQWARDGAKAWEEYLAAPDIAAAKTARLRQARLERDAAEKVAAEKAESHRVRLLKKALMAKSDIEKGPSQ
jgi:hypothetical protein